MTIYTSEEDRLWRKARDLYRAAPLPPRLNGRRPAWYSLSTEVRVSFYELACHIEEQEEITRPDLPRPRNTILGVG